MKSKPYSKYNYTTIDVIEKIPLSWSIHKLKYLKSDEKYSIVDGPFGTQLHNDEYVDEGVPVVRVTNLDFNGNFHSENLVFITEEKYNSLKRSSIKENDLIIAKTGATIGKTGLFVGFDKGIVSSSCFKLAIKKHINLNLIKYLLISNVGQKQILILSSGATRDSMNIEEFSNIVFPIPNNTDEQNQIVNFLDKKVNIIDNTIEKDKELIELLKEKRNALINQAVTKGLNPNVPMKDSGIEWIGEIPKNWQISKIKYELEFLDYKRRPLSAEIRGEMDNKIYDYYGASGVIDKVDSYIFDGKFLLVGEDGANLLSRSTSLSFLAEGKFWVNNHAHILNVKNGILDYYVYLLEAIDYTPYIEGSAQPKLTAENLKNIQIVSPPKFEQKSISEYLNTKVNTLNQIIEKTETKIGLLEEYKASLIYNVVTGKVDVRGVEV